MKRRRVVITGLGVVAPNGIGKDAFWANLVAGHSAVDYITAFDASSFPCKVAGEVRNFSPTDFMSIRKAQKMARFSQFAIAATRLALEDAKLSLTPALSPDIAVSYGTSMIGVEVGEEAAEAFRLKGVRGVRPWTALEFPPHAPASWITVEFGIRGPARSISSNCCTGLDAVQAGVSQILLGRAKVVVTGSCEVPLTPVSFASFCALGALTKRNDDPHKASRPYDLLRDGLILSEGAATLVLEDLEFALQRRTHIYAEVLGYGAASEAIDMREGDLSGTVMANAIKEAIRSADLSPNDIDHINAHGSSLPDFDVCDSNSFKLGLGEHAYRIPVSSIKSMIGQPISAAGTLQIVAACLSIQHQMVPPTINQEVSDPRCDLDYVPNTARIARVKRVLVNGHSFGGSTAAMIVGRVDA